MSVSHVEPRKSYLDFGESMRTAPERRQLATVLVEGVPAICGSAADPNRPPVPVGQVDDIDIDPMCVLAWAAAGSQPEPLLEGTRSASE
jgi:hypothetical protein